MLSLSLHPICLNVFGYELSEMIMAEKKRLFDMSWNGSISDGVFADVTVK